MLEVLAQLVEPLLLSLSRPKTFLYTTGTAMVLIATGLMVLWFRSKALGGSWNTTDIFFAAMIAVIYILGTLVLVLAGRTENA